MEGFVNHTSPVEHNFQQRIPVRRILIACIGNIFLGDDSFGVEVAQRLVNRKTKKYPEGVQVVDFGIRGIDLAYTLLDEYDTLVLVDAVSRGGSPGTLYLIEPDLTGIDPVKGVVASRAAMDAHSMDPALLNASEDYADMQMGLSEPVKAAIDEAVKMIDSLVDELLTMKM